ncbi:unnamed protein product [Phytophthora fragariaefolia]|uniref:Unnamed protein product n=1 Tax=Phytophthora fragariaefolia TaxID=1490495 RepID=A0A9W7CRC3_9STRA|nr:unnamed protein product [Phytophthora fragariaefolia]
MPSHPTKRLRLTWVGKVGIVNKAAQSPIMSYKENALWAVTEYSLPAAPGITTICDLVCLTVTLLGRSVENATRKKAQQCSHVVLDQNVMDFIMLAEADGVRLTGAMIEHAR